MPKQQKITKKSVLYMFFKGAVHKTSAVERVRTSALWRKKLQCFEIYDESARTRVEGSIFGDFMRTSFIDGPKRLVT